MMPRPDVLIVGAGITGLSLALELARTGAGSVAVLERQQPGAGASGRSGGIVRVHNADLEEAKLARTGLRRFREWSDHVGGDCGLQSCGLVVIPTLGAEAALARRTEGLREAGVDTRMVGADQASAIDPALRLPDGVTHVAYEPDAGCVDANLAVRTLADAARRHGVEIRCGCEVQAILHLGDRVVGVQTTAGSVQADTIVIAAGTRSHDLLLTVGIDLGLQLGLARVAVYPAPPARPWPHPVVIDEAESSWFRPFCGGATLAGVERHPGPVQSGDAETAADVAFIRSADRALSARFPVMAGVTARGRWAGTFATSPDGRPAIGAVDAVDGLYVIAGDGGTSFKTAPAIGIGLAELILQQGPHEVDLRAFAPARLVTGALAPPPTNGERCVA